MHTFPQIVMYPSPYKNNTKYTLTASYKCAKVATGTYFVKAVMSTTSTSVTDYSALKSQSGCSA